MEKIQFIDLKKLEPDQQDVVKKISTEYYGKIERELRNITALVIHIKEYKKGHKFSIHMRAEAPTGIFESKKAADWDLARTMHKAFKDLEREIQHAIHKDKGWKPTNEQDE